MVAGDKRLLILSKRLSTVCKIVLVPKRVHSRMRASNRPHTLCIGSWSHVKRGSVDENFSRSFTHSCEPWAHSAQNRHWGRVSRPRLSETVQDGDWRSHRVLWPDRCSATQRHGNADHSA